MRLLNNDSRKSVTLVFLLLTSYISCFSQISQTMASTKPVNLKLAYNSSLIYSGIRLGVEFPVKSREKKDYVNDLFITANLSGYHHPGFHDNLYATTGLLMRKTRPDGFFTEFSPEAGYSRTFLGGKTYRVDLNGVVTKVPLAGYNYALISVGEGLGYDFSRTKSIPVLGYFKFNLLAMFPYNSSIYLRPAMEIGFIYKPSKIKR